ncbi:Down-regulator of invasive growth [Dirofilaria immitis]
MWPFENMQDSHKPSTITTTTANRKMPFDLRRERKSLMIRMTRQKRRAYFLGELAASYNVSLPDLLSNTLFRLYVIVLAVVSNDFGYAFE